MRKDTNGDVGSGSNFDKDWTQERISSNTLNEPELEKQLKDSLNYVLREGKRNEGNSIWHGNNGDTSGMGRNSSKNVVMTGVDQEGVRNVLLKIDLSNLVPEKYLVGIYTVSGQEKGTLTLGLAGCSNSSNSQCQIQKQQELTDKRIQIVFS